MVKCRVWLVLAAVVVVGIGVLLWAARQRLQNHLTVENRSGQSIALFQVSTGGETVLFHDVPDGVVVAAAFVIRGDDSFAVECQLADGTKVEGDFGYVTGGMYGERASFIVNASGKITFEESSTLP